MLTERTPKVITSGYRTDEWGGELGEGSSPKDQDGESRGIKKHYEIQQQVRPASFGIISTLLWLVCESS